MICVNSIFNTNLTEKRQSITITALQFILRSSFDWDFRYRGLSLVPLSHSRTFEDAQREEKRAAKKPRAKKEETVKIDNQPASTTLGDIDVLTQLKAQMEKGE